MTLIKPFLAQLAHGDRVEDMVAPPYDVVSRAQASQLAENKAFNILHLSRPEIDFETNVDGHEARVYQRGRANLEAFLEQNVFLADSGEHYYLYQIRCGNHSQTGLVCMVDTQAYLDGRLRKHEHTHQHKVEDRLQLTETLDAQISPVLLTYRHRDDIKQTIHQICHNTSPHFDINYQDGNQHRLWRVSDPEWIAKLQTQMDSVGHLYIADGHHRCATMSQVKQRCSDQDKAGIFAVIFPDDELQILGYHRLIEEVTPTTRGELLSRLSQYFEVRSEPQAPDNLSKAQFGLHLEGEWYSLSLKAEFLPKTMPEALDGQIFQQFIMGPMFDIHDQRNARQLSFVGGRDAIDVIETQVKKNASTVGLTLPPISIEEILQVSDLERSLPPKSTWFEPKLLDGFLIHLG